jgi:hypothetical protein
MAAVRMRITAPASDPCFVPDWSRPAVWKRSGRLPPRTDARTTSGRDASQAVGNVQLADVCSMHDCHATAENRNGFGP